jgi:hypothetical protein
VIASDAAHRAAKRHAKIAQHRVIADSVTAALS